MSCRKPAAAQGTTSLRHAHLPQCIPMSEATFATVSSMYVVGGLIGALLAGPTSSNFGRLLAMRLTSFFFIVGSTIQTLAATVPIISIGRLLVGIGAGASTVVVPLYISEVSPPRERGLFGTMTQVTINIGLLVSQTMGYYLSRGSDWRIILGVGGILGLCQALGLLFVPESPSWLAARGKTNPAERILRRIRGSGKSIEEEIEHWGPDKSAVEEHESLLRREGLRTPGLHSPDSQDLVPAPHVGFFEIIFIRQYQKAIVAVIGIMVTQQFCGINSIMMYSVSLLSGVLPVSSSLITIMISVVNLMVTIGCAPLPDKIGRKACLLLSIGGMGSMSLLLALALRLEFKLLAAISVILFVAFFATGLGPVPFLMASELVGHEAVGATQSWCLASNYVATYVVAQFFPIINTALNHRFGGAGWVYFIFAGLAVLGFLFVGKYVPETKGKTVEEIWERSPKATRVD